MVEDHLHIYTFVSSCDDYFCLKEGAAVVGVVFPCVDVLASCPSLLLDNLSENKEE